VPEQIRKRDYLWGVQQMRKVPIENARPGMVTKKPILGFLGQVLLNSDITINQRHIYYLRQMGIGAIYIHDDRMNDVVVEEPVSSEVRGESRALVARIIRDLDSAGVNSKGIAINDKAILKTVSKIVEEVIEHKEVLNQLSDIRAHDGYLFAHSVNCCVIAALIAVKMNYDLKTIRILATGSLLHDIGLVAVPRMVLSKPGLLSEEEFLVVKRHPRLGYELLKGTRLFSERVAGVILQHHERIQGQGYPCGLKGKEIASLARIVAVADVYDALTSDKSYREAYPVHIAIEMMTAWGGELFDLDVLNTFLENVTAFPVGSHVLLNSGESGFVVENTPGFSYRPVVRILYKDEYTPHPAPFDLDLKKVLDLTVERLVSENEILSG
jgi:HD-GYP domain-containing protein (c-di-GMP phosphodiesterase class II)